ncbi:MAG: hypothetical protein RLZZ488_320 [Pseudomonadota bacterium]|jgi:NitT/TauT family transport system ATP-binding protein
MNVELTAFPLVECKNVSLSFSSRRVIEDFSLSVNAGDRIAFLGPSGCGKSTLLNLLSGLLKPTHGNVVRKVTSDKISFVFQDPSLFPWKTVRENIALVDVLANASSTDAVVLRSNIDAQLEQVGLLESADAYPDELSGGMRMRVALARALINKPQLLLLDEPFAALDDMTRERLQDDLLKLQQNSSTAFILVTHNIEEALYLCRRVFVFAQNGRVLKEYLQPKSDEAFRRDAPALNELRREIRELWFKSSRGEV